jgi:chromosome segregation ATPase
VQRSIKTGNDTILARTATLTENQKALGSHLDVLTATTSQTAIDVMTLGSNQSKLAQTVQNGLTDLTGRADRITASQEKTQGSVDVLTAAAGQTALDLIDVAKRQDAIQKSIQSHNESATAQIAGLAESHRKTHSSMDILTATTGQTATDVIEMTRRQDGLQRSMQNYAEATGSQMATLAGNQQKLQSGMDTLTATAAQTALDVISVTSRQETLQKAIQDHSNASAAQMGKLAQSQQHTQSGVDALTAVAGQTAVDVIEITNRQDGLRKAMQSHDETVGGRIAKLSESQEKVQTGLEAVTATTGRTVRDVVALSEAQARSEQTAQAGRVEVAAKLTEIAQAQQGWLQRFDTAQASIQAMADGIATLDQQFARLRGALQAGVQSTTNLLDANGKQRQQFEAGVAQDMKAMIEAIAQLRQAQAQLQEQMSQVQKSTQSQAETLKATIDQIKQPPAEIKVSDAAKPVEPVVVQTGE